MVTHAPAPSTSTIDVRPDPSVGASAVWLRRAFIALLALIAVGGALGLFGVRTRSVTAQSADGSTTLTVRYAHVARAGLSVPFQLTVRRPGGFTDPITLTVSSDYLDFFDRNAVEPPPESATATGDMSIWSFDAPPGDTFVASIDMQVQGGRHWGKSGTVTVLDSNGSPVVAAHFTTWLVP